MSVVRKGSNPSAAVVRAALRQLRKIGGSVGRMLQAEPADSRHNEHQVEANAPLPPDLAALLAGQAPVRRDASRRLSGG
jgi:hypothetical protein